MRFVSPGPAQYNIQLILIVTMTDSISSGGEGDDSL